MRENNELIYQKLGANPTNLFDFQFVAEPFFWILPEEPTRMDELIYFRANRLITCNQYHSLKGVPDDNYEQFKKNHNLVNLRIYRRSYGNIPSLYLIDLIKNCDEIEDVLNIYRDILEFYYPSVIHFFHFINTFNKGNGKDDVKELMEAFKTISYNQACEEAREVTNTYILSRRHVRNIIENIEADIESLIPHFISLDALRESDSDLLEIDRREPALMFNKESVQLHYRNYDDRDMLDNFTRAEAINNRLESWKEFKFNHADHTLSDEEIFGEENKILSQEDKDKLLRYELFLELQEEFKDCKKLKDDRESPKTSSRKD